MHFRIFIAVLAISCGLVQAQSPLLVGSDEYAFQFTGNLNVGMFFNGTDGRYELMDGTASPVFWFRPSNQTAMIGGKLAIGTTPSTAALQVEGATVLGSTTDFVAISGVGDLSFNGDASYLVGNNQFAFQAASDSDIGLFFNATDRQYEFKSSTAGTVLEIGADADHFALRDASGNSVLAMNAAGQLGVNQPNPVTALDINGGVRVSYSGDEFAGVIRFDTTINRFAGYNGTEWTALDKGQNWSGNDQTNSTFREGQVRIGTNLFPSDDQVLIDNGVYANALKVRIDSVIKFVVTSTGGTSIGGAVATPPEDGLYVKGDVTIGTNTPADGYKLSVDGKVMCETVRVQNSMDWPDYVFEEDYELLPIRTVRDQIEVLGHLPGIPAAEQVAMEGVDLSEMQVSLLEKVEELTLYIIQLNEKMEALESENARISEELETLK